MKKRNNATFSQKQMHIMQVALEIFAQKGYNGSSVRDIALASNVNLAMINYYFGSKLQLLEAIFENMTEVSKSHLDASIIDHNLSPTEKLEHIIDGYTHFALENKHFIVLLMRQQFAANTDSIDDFIFTLKFRYWRIFHNALEEAKKLNFFRKDVNIVTLISMIMGTLNYLISDRNFLSKSKGIDSTDDQLYEEQIVTDTMNNIKSILKEYILKK